MASAIEAHERLVKDVFSDDYGLPHPDYQRPYAWELESSARLLGDLIAVCPTTAEPVDALEPYFLGSTVLVGAGEGNRYEVVDGQQRLTTLSIFLAAAAERLGDDGEQLRSLIYQPPKPLLGIDATPRLSLRRARSSVLSIPASRKGRIVTAPGR